jgi:hypothetical protein
MHGPIRVKSLNNTSKWQMGFNSAFKGLMFHPRKEISSVPRRVVYFYSKHGKMGESQGLKDITIYKYEGNKFFSHLLVQNTN